MTSPAKKLIDMLPGVLRRADEESQRSLKSFIAVFEKLITGVTDLDSEVTVGPLPAKSIGEAIDLFPSYFHPETAPSEFLDWLSSWVGLVLKEDWAEEKKRTVLARIIPLYRMRGTRKGLEEYLNIYTHGGVSINDDVGLFQVGINSRVGISTAIDLTNFFTIVVRLSEAEQTLEAINSKKLMIESIIEREKPVHTRYKLIWENVHSLQVGIRSQVEINTLLWSYE